MRVLQTAIKEQEARAAQLLKEAQAEKAAAGRAHAAAKERASAELRQQLDALTSAQQEIARLEVRLLLPAPLCPEKCAPLSKSSFSLKLISACSSSYAQQPLHHCRVFSSMASALTKHHSMVCDIGASLA